MRPAFFIIAIFIIVVLSPYPSICQTLAQSPTVAISAFVDEHLTYFQDGNDLIISTNSRAQYLVLSPTGDLIGQISGPIDGQTMHLTGQRFILVAQP